MRPSELIYLPRRESFVPESFSFIESYEECLDYDVQVRRVYGWMNTPQAEFTDLVRRAFFFLVSDLPNRSFVITVDNAQAYQRAKDLFRVAGFTDMEIMAQQAVGGGRVRDVIGHPLYPQQIDRFNRLLPEFGFVPSDIKQQERWNVPPTLE